MFFVCFFIFFYDTSVTFHASMFCDSGLYMHCRLCDSFFHLFLPTLFKMGSYNPPLPLVKRVGSRPGSVLSVLGTIILQMVSAGGAILYYIL